MQYIQYFYGDPLYTASAPYTDGDPLQKYSGGRWVQGRLLRPVKLFRPSPPVSLLGLRFAPSLWGGNFASHSIGVNHVSVQ